MIVMHPLVFISLPENVSPLHEFSDVIGTLGDCNNYIAEEYYDCVIHFLFYASAESSAVVGNDKQISDSANDARSHLPYLCNNDE
jgi:hypothetical protein